VGDLKWCDINGNGKQAQTDDEKATTLLDFFSTVYTVMANAAIVVYTTDNDNDFNSTNTRINDSGKKSTDLIISVNDIYDKLCQLKTGKSPGPDRLHPRILYESRDVVVCPLFLIFKTVLRQV